ncbi:Putative LOC100377198 [Caligus rogercresseyi]|uniref:LOC100377198 n=1 Tax=Caligus rogercresseyi TaxID=217165 RepID=A0A7T8JZZ0_CALRO|nr:Putative LOC100377198 [Caligus rogercresseyi]
MSPKGRSAKSVLVTGCDSGVALEVVKALAQQAEGQSNVAVILAAAKNPNNSELNHLAKSFSKVKTVQLDLKIKRILETLPMRFRRGSMMLVNVDAGHMIKAFSVNAVSPLMLIKALSKQLQSGAQAAGSGVAAGSAAGVDAMMYSSSKASHAAAEMGGPADAMNAATYGAAHSGASLGAGAAASSGTGASALNAVAAGANLSSGLNAGARFGVGGPNSGAILTGEAGSAFSGNGGGLVVNLTTGLSSAGANNSGRFYAYRASKSALNMITKNVAADLASSGILAFALNIDNAALDSRGAGVGSQGNNGNSTQGFSAQSVAEAITALVNRGNSALSGSLINVEGAPLLV